MSDRILLDVSVEIPVFWDGIFNDLVVPALTRLAEISTSNQSLSNFICFNLGICKLNKYCIATSSIRLIPYISLWTKSYGP